MLKFVFNFRTRGVWCLCGGVFPTKMLPGINACVIFASEEMEMWWTHGGMKYVWIYQSSIIFCRLALNLGHHILALDWNLQHGFKRRRDSVDWPLNLLFHSVFVSLGLHCFFLWFVRKRCFCNSKKLNNGR